MSEDEILAYRSGQADAELLMAIDDHLDRCNSCLQLVELVIRDELDLNPHPSQLTTFHDGSIVAGRYRIESFIGKGGMGEVYAAKDELTRRRVALKTVLCTATDDPRAIRKLMGEVVNAQRVAHPHVFKIYDLHEHHVRGQRSTPFFTMELIEGESLGKRLRRAGPLSIVGARRIARQLLAGLGAAHDKGVLHLDFKSDNVMLRQCDGEFEAVIMDFGLSRLEGSDGKQRTSERMQGAGTMPYMALEQLECSKHIGPPTDVYAFGVVLYEMLTGVLPFRGDSMAAMLLKQVTERPLPPSRHVSGLASSVDTFVLKCLHRNADSRFADAGLALAALDALGEWTEPPRSMLGPKVWAWVAALVLLGTVGAWMGRVGSPARIEVSQRSAAQPLQPREQPPAAPVPAGVTPAASRAPPVEPSPAPRERSSPSPGSPRTASAPGTVPVPRPLPEAQSRPKRTAWTAGKSSASTPPQHDAVSPSSSRAKRRLPSDGPPSPASDPDAATSDWHGPPPQAVPKPAPL